MSLKSYTMKPIDPEKWKAVLDDLDYEEPGGVMACSPEIFSSMQDWMEKELGIKKGDPVLVLGKPGEYIVEYTDGSLIFVKNKDGDSCGYFPVELDLESLKI